MTVALSPTPMQRFCDSAGNALVGGLLYTYAAGTSTPQVSYVDSTQTTPNTNPIVLNSRGECGLWLDQSLSYKLVLMSAGGALIWSVDNIVGVASSGGGGGGGSILASTVLFDDTTSAGMFSTRLSRIVSSIAALRAVSHVLYTNVTASGYYSAGDGGGGLYYYDAADTTSSDNGGTIIVANDGGRWKLAQTDPVSFKQFGCKIDGTTNDTGAAQAAINSGLRSLFLPSSANGLRTTSPLTIPTGITIYGESTSPYGIAGPFNTRQPGSWFFFDHLGIGIKATNSAGANPISGVKFQGIGTYRKHANAVGAGWTPTAFDYDIVCDDTDMVLDDVCMLNANKGLNVTNGNYGRINATNVRGQWFAVGINVDVSYDVVRLTNISMWPFWSNDSNVTGWQKLNTQVIALNRCDGPHLSNIFSIYSAKALAMYQNAAGTVSKIHVLNMDCDNALIGIFVDTSVTSGVTGQFVNVTNYGPDIANTNSNTIKIAGSACRLDFANIEGEHLSRGLITVGGTNNIVRMSGVRVSSWDGLSVSAPLIDCGTGNNIWIADGLVTAGTGTVLFNAAGIIKYPQGVRTGSATITSAATSVVVNHTLPATPANTQIQLSMLTGLGSAKSVWITGVTSTQFTINCDTAPGASITIAWRAALE